MLKLSAIGGKGGREGGWQHNDEGSHRDLCYSLQNVPSLIQETWWYSSKTMAPCIRAVKGQVFRW